MLTLETAPYEMIVLTEMRSVQNEILCGPQENSRDQWRTWQLVFLVLGVIHKWSKSDIVLLVHMWNERTGE